MEDQLLERNLSRYERLTLDEMLEKAGVTGKYQLRILVIYLLSWFFAAFIQMGFPIIFQPARFLCPQHSPCTEEEACENGYELSDEVRSVAYTFNLTCDRSRMLRSCFDAFLYGGFIGSLYYGEIIERRGRRYAVVESLIVMSAGIYLSLLAGNITIFSIGVFLFNAGFRGFYNASLLTLAEVVSEVSRASVPMLLSIGWALGQITIAMVSYGVTSWRIIFALTAVPLSILVYFAYKHTLESPRYLVVKHQFDKAKDVIRSIAIANDSNFSSAELTEQISYNEKMKAYREIMGAGEITLRLKHHSYTSLFRYNSIRVRVLIVGAVWSLFSLSYFISAFSQINPTKSISFNIAVAGGVEIIAYFFSIVTSLNYGRTIVIRKLLIISGIIHICFYFIGPLNTYHGLGKIIIMCFDVAIRVTVSIGNTFLAIYAIELFPTSIRHFALGMLGFITKLMYMLALPFNNYWSWRHIHPNFIIGVLMLTTFFFTQKLRETQSKGLKDNLSEDGDGTMMNEMQMDIV